MKYYLSMLAVMFLTVLAFNTCGSKSKVSHGGPVLDYVSLLDSLRAVGATVELAGEIVQPFFSVKGHRITVNGGDVQVFEFADAEDVQAKGEQVSPDGEWVSKTHVNWIATPHFYKRGKLIVIYAGDDRAIIETLEPVLAPQFAGG